jgi:RNA polymerase sigma-70 factor (ECF subfamily)
MGEEKRAGSEWAGFAVRDRTMLVALAERVAGASALADDAVQDALVALWRSGEPVRRPRAWMARTIVHRGLTARRSAERRRVWERQAAECLVEDAAPQDPETLLLRREAGAEVTKSLERLPAAQRQVIELRQLEGLHYEEIAHELHVPVGTVRSRLARARSALQSSLLAEGAGIRRTP